ASLIALDGKQKIDAHAALLIPAAEVRRRLVVACGALGRFGGAAIDLSLKAGVATGAVGIRLASARRCRAEGFKVEPKVELAARSCRTVVLIPEGYDGDGAARPEERCPLVEQLLIDTFLDYAAVGGVIGVARPPHQRCVGLRLHEETIHGLQWHLEAAACLAHREQRSLHLCLELAGVIASAILKHAAI